MNLNMSVEINDLRTDEFKKGKINILLSNKAIYKINIPYKNSI
jgi:hypothetical protein